jgi:hypothetical protein
MGTTAVGDVRGLLFRDAFVEEYGTLGRGLLAGGMLYRVLLQGVVTVAQP